MKLLPFFFIGVLIIIALGAQNAINLHGEIQLTPDKVALIAVVIVLGAIAIIDRRAFGVIMLILIGIAVFVTLMRDGKMPWQP